MSAGLPPSLLERLTVSPLPVNRVRANRLLRDFNARCLSEGVADFTLSDPLARLLVGIADQSTFLWQAIMVDPARMKRLAHQSPELALASLLSRLDDETRHVTDERVLMKSLRLARQESSLLIALADLGGIWDVPEVTAALSEAADQYVGVALRFLLEGVAQQGLLRVDAKNPEVSCGLVVVALGKHGAMELNYSSDIDLCVFYDPECQALREGVEPAALYIKLTKKLARLLQERDADGYVARVDLRLRPDPGSTSVAVSLPAALGYYETLGQNWERAAFIKARPIAGDIEMGRRFLSELSPFIWRKYFDYAAIADIHAMKRQIHAVRGHAEVAVAGHDVKLGRGGIREIEFFVQTQQLIFGGRRPHLRGPQTLGMLAQLSQDGWVAPKAVKDLTAAYMFLRRIEHRLQMVADEQTQRLPSEPEALKSFARFCGYAGLARFSRDLTHHLSRVEGHYARLFEQSPGLDAAGGSLVFTGADDDPETLETLGKMGFRSPEMAAETIRGWHFGRRQGVQSARAREVLTELVPGLLEAFSGSGDPDGALATFDHALAKMPAAVELFSILKSNSTIRDLFADILGGAPRLARLVSARPHVLDAAIDPDMMAASANEASLNARAAHIAALNLPTEDFLDAIRDFGGEENFRIGIGFLSGLTEPEDTGRAFSALASSIVNITLSYVQQHFEAEHGRVHGGCCAVLALGKLGSREMTAASDLDLVLLYDFDSSAALSDGARPLHPVVYYTRLTQRLISALTVTTRKGSLYEVDMRLRPSGNKGPVATQFDGFVAYQNGEAETWEHMALTRARVVAGDAVFKTRIQKAITDILSRPISESRLAKEIADMRALIAESKGDGGLWDVKLSAGGLMDVEFIAQYLVLLHSAKCPQLLVTSTLDILETARTKGLVDRKTADRLIAAHKLATSITQMARIAMDGEFNPKHASYGVLKRIASAANLPDFAILERELSETYSRTRAIFVRLVGGQATSSTKA